MNFPQIQMESQLAKIQIKQTPATVNIKQERAIQTIEQPNAELAMETTKGKLTIDQTQAWEDRNLMSTRRLNELHAQEGMRQAREGVARRAEQGAELVKIENGINVIAEQALQNVYPQIKELSINYIPSPFSVKISYERGDLNIDVKRNKPMIDVQINKPEIDVDRGGVDISMAQYANVNIDFINLYV